MPRRRSLTRWSNGTWSSSSGLGSAFQPATNPIHRFMYFGGGAGIAEAQEMPAVDRIEINAGRGGDVRFIQHALGEIEAVARKTRNVRVKIKRSIHRQELVQPRLRQTFGKNTAILLIAVLDRFHLCASVKRSFRRDLRERRH